MTSDTTLESENLVADGLFAPVTVTVDESGISHIDAQSPDDVFFAQGYIAARDRLFQLDWWRRKGLGLISEVLGPQFVERDRAARLFLYRGDQVRDWETYAPDAELAVRRFVAGINAFIASTEAKPSLLPPEFTKLGYTPPRWAPEDITRIRSHGLFGNLEQEVARAQTLHKFGPQVEDVRRHREPAIDVTIPEGLDLSLFDDEVLRVYRLATGPLSTTPLPAQEPDGSNNWAIAATRTATGRPILASDPHRAIGLPSLRYLVHLRCPEFDVIGAGEPALPGVSLGHNGHVAFGLTIFPVDQEDLYVYELHPADPSLYRYLDGWRRMDTITESIPVAGGPDAEVTLAHTVHGPVIHVDHNRLAAFAVRAAWLEPGMAPYLASLAYLRARNGGDFADALSRWRAPGVNHVYADVDGTIGWNARALVPVRPNWDGLLPVPGDGRFEWDGFQPADALPSVVDPPRGWVASANEMNLPGRDEWDPIPVSYEWYANCRAQRIAEVLGDDSEMTIARSAALQNDYLSIPAREVCALLTRTPSEDPDIDQAIRLLTQWDHRMSATSGAAALFETWFRGELRTELYDRFLQNTVDADQTDDALAATLPDETMAGDPAIDLLLLQQEQARDPEQLQTVLRRTLVNAFRRLKETLGEDHSTWTWGRLHRTVFRHPLHSVLDDPSDHWMTLGPYPKHGSPDTVGVASYDPQTGFQTAGATFRMVIDVGNWDASLAINAPGQSGDPRDAAYQDLIDDWLTDAYFPLNYSAHAIDQNARSTFHLRPGSPT
ncbi:penicillin acylase family protein [Rhodococcus sp. NPDC059968]|uniref:penicillin acylase family protein n=1 Tax=Rhodococcus sp. NPDC059968 TaxID=3347017 RepID=UPI00366EB42F